MKVYIIGKRNDTQSHWTDSDGMIFFKRIGKNFNQKIFCFGFNLQVAFVSTSL